MAQFPPKKKHSLVPETNFPYYDNESISTNITLKSEYREKENENCNTANEVNLLENMASNSRNIDDFHCLKSKTEGYALELLNQIKSCTEFDKETLLHTAKQLCSLKNNDFFKKTQASKSIN